MTEVEFWITIKGTLDNKEAKSFWLKIREDKKINLFVLESETYVYGTASEYVIEYVLYQSAKLGFPVELKTK